MYLKALEIQGFKSFADRTRLTFEPGMIAIVGPNGCGKSNVSDAIRWVLGEQRPSALRCSKMQDLIFNGTDARKPLGMVEVSLHFSECEEALGTEYAEVSIARRAYRSGENTYFLNKTPCRLKDIQRLFMGTGVGTTSYSVMAQGQIDAILSSRPEDRRAVFEEAAGVTKFKADRKEALRKIQQTEENLTRITDILRELKRQGTLLQRQAEKAERARTLRTELRGLDIYLSKQRAKELEDAIAEAALRVAEAGNRIFTIQDEAEAGARAIAAVNAQIQENEDAITHFSELAAASIARHSRAKEIIQTNLTRIAEYRSWAEGLEHEIEEARTRLEDTSSSQEDLEALAAFDDELESLQLLLDDAQDNYDTQKYEVDQTRLALQEARNGLNACDQKQLHFQQTLAQADAQREAQLLKRERLTAETTEAQRLRDERLALRETAQIDAEKHLALAQEAREALIVLDEDRSFIADDIDTAKKHLQNLQTQHAALTAQRELLQQSDQHTTANTLFIDPENPLQLQPGEMLGFFADLINIPPEMATLAEIVLKPWSNAVVVSTPEVAHRLLQARTTLAPETSLDILVLSAPPPTDSLPNIGQPLIDALSIQPGFEPLLQRLLYGWVIVDTLPNQLPAGLVAAIDRQGNVRLANGDAYYHNPNTATDPIHRRLKCETLDQQCQTLQASITQQANEIETLMARYEALGLKLRDTQKNLEKSQRLANQAEGAFAAADRDAKQAETRYNQCAIRLSELQSETTHDDEARQHARTGLLTLAEERESFTLAATRATERLTLLEGTLDTASARLSEARFRMVGFTQKREHALALQRERTHRRQELEETIFQRQASVKSCIGNIERLENDNLSITASLDNIAQETLDIQQKIEAARAERLEKNAQRDRLEAETAQARQTLLESQEAKTRAEVAMAEARTRYQALIDRLHNDYGVLPGTLNDEPCAQWEDEDALPSHTWIETRMTDIREELDRIGPVNLLAIDEYKALEERHTFYQTQADDLTRSRDELLSLIRTINETSGKRFRETFDRANQNFEKMFTRLFHGGEARLVLLENAEDPLECGIDIIARPPGKKPQTISLLSGGERTMTAVSLLFAIFLIKPAPFCLLDELDAALDDSNIGRFVDALKDFLVHSQFLIITHNQHTIAGSDIVYGVTMPEKGVSRTLSMRFKKDA